MSKGAVGAGKRLGTLEVVSVRGCVRRRVSAATCKLPDDSVKITNLPSFRHLETLIPNWNTKYILIISYQIHLNH